MFPEPFDNGKLQVVAAHAIPERVFQSSLAYNILEASNTAPGQMPVIEFSVTDPTNSNKPWNLLTDGPFTHCSDPAAQPNLSIAVAWNTSDYTNPGQRGHQRSGPAYQPPRTKHARPK